MKRKNLILKTAVAMLAFGGFGVVSNFANSTSVYAMESNNTDTTFFRVNVQQIINGTNVTVNDVKSTAKELDEKYKIDQLFATMNTLRRDLQRARDLRQSEDIQGIGGYSVQGPRYQVHLNTSNSVKSLCKNMKKTILNLKKDVIEKAQILNEAIEEAVANNNIDNNPNLDNARADFVKYKAAALVEIAKLKFGYKEKKESTFGSTLSSLLFSSNLGLENKSFRPRFDEYELIRKEYQVPIDDLPGYTITKGYYDYVPVRKFLTDEEVVVEENHDTLTKELYGKCLEFEGTGNLFENTIKDINNSANL